MPTATTAGAVARIVLAATRRLRHAVLRVKPAARLRRFRKVVAERAGNTRVGLRRVLPRLARRLEPATRVVRGTVGAATRRRTLRTVGARLLRPVRKAPARAAARARQGAKAIRRGVKIGAERMRTAAMNGRRSAAKSALIGRQLVSYRVPGEATACPACGHRPISHLEPLALLNAPAVGWRFGFISGCRRCGIIFANPLPQQEELDHTYSAEGDWGRDRQDEHESQVTRARLQQLFAPIKTELDVLVPPTGAMALDFGCGLGGMLDALAELGWTTCGLDPATKVAFRRHREYTRVPDAPEFELVILHHVLEHVTEPLAILTQLAGATRVGGYILVSVPNLDTVNKHGQLEYCIRSRIHVTAYTSRALEWLCAAAGFRVVSSTEFGSDARRQVVLARRESAAVPRPAEPLAAAERALAAYYASHPQDEAPLRGAPVRLRATIANLSRLGRHRPAHGRPDPAP